MKKWFYYFRDTKNRPQITVCLISLKGKLSRGIAICSTKDNFSKKTYVDDNGEIVKGGRDIAEERAMTAMLDEENSEPIYRSECDDVLFNCGFDLKTEYKSEFNPELSKFEFKLVMAKYMAKKQEVSNSLDLFGREIERLKDEIISGEHFEFDRIHNGKDKINFRVNAFRDSHGLFYDIKFSSIN